MRVNDIISEKKENVPNDKSLWGRAKAEAKKKYKKYPSAYANSYASKKYKEWGGTWKSINESFDTSYDWEWSHKDSNMILAEFKLDTGEYIYVDFRKIETTNNGWDVGFSRNEISKATGEGDQFKIFSTVIDIIKTFIEKTPDLEYLEFIADKRQHERGNARNTLTRASLYKKMVKTLSNKYNLDYKIFDGSKKTKFKLFTKEKLNEVTRPKTQKDADEILQNAGYSRIGHGSFGAVYQKEGSDKVIKTFNSIDTSYLKFIKMVKNSDYNPHFPLFYGNPMKINDDYFAIKQESLTIYNGDPTAINFYIKYLMSEDISYEPPYYEEIEEIEYEYPRFKEACQMIAGLAKNNPDIKLDMQKNNIMKRGRTIVFVDPIANAKNSDDQIKSLPNIGTWPKKEPEHKHASKDKKINWSKRDSEILAQLGINENLKDWHDEEWVDISRKVDGKHPPCGDSANKGHRKSNDNKAYPKCVKKSKAHSMSAKEKESSSRRKRNNQRDKKGKTTNQVDT